MEANENVDAVEAAKKQVELEQAAQRKKENKKRLMWFLFFAITGSLFIGLISLNHRLGEAEKKVKTAETDLALIKTKSENLSDSVKSVITFVKDTIYPVLFEQQSYVKTFEKKFKSVNSDLSLVDSRLKKVNQNLESFRSNQVSFVSAFDKNLQEVKNKYDSLDAQVKKPIILSQTNSVVPVLTLPTDTQKPKTLVIENKKIPSQSNGGKGGQKKIRFDKIFGKPTSKFPGW
ncbi:MAG: hypothetical protein WCJ57_03375 [Candidatus Falkowbacteria bacterium]